ncbi:hypothetical protein [Brevibacterium litoralis]|uniref:hypothetical protein n=1 Tax=Brevibacterium litoralis TaxID=3138935 RepID=UPI0032F0859C
MNRSRTHRTHRARTSLAQAPVLGNVRPVAQEPSHTQWTAGWSLLSVPLSILGLAVMALALVGCSRAVPRDFPDEVPLVTGDVLELQELGDGWSFVSEAGADELEAALSALQDAGFEVIGSTGIDEETGGTEPGAAYSLANPDYSVRLGVSANGEHLTYGVAER